MSIESWTDEGMDWSDPNPLEAKYWLALMRAAQERWFPPSEATSNAIVSNQFFPMELAGLGTGMSNNWGYNEAYVTKLYYAMRFVATIIRYMANYYVNHTWNGGVLDGTSDFPPVWSDEDAIWALGEDCPTLYDFRHWSTPIGQRQRIKFNGVLPNNSDLKQLMKNFYTYLNAFRWFRLSVEPWSMSSSCRKIAGGDGSTPTEAYNNAVANLSSASCTEGSGVFGEVRMTSLAGHEPPLYNAVIETNIGITGYNILNIASRGAYRTGNLECYVKFEKTSSQGEFASEFGYPENVYTLIDTVNGFSPLKRNHLPDSCRPTIDFSSPCNMPDVSSGLEWGEYVYRGIQAYPCYYIIKFDGSGGFKFKDW